MQPLCICADLLRVNYLPSVVIQPSYDNTQGRAGKDKQRANEVKMKGQKNCKNRGYDRKKVIEFTGSATGL